jgi:hypothetical protein
MSTQGDIEPARIRSNRANSSNTANAHFGTSGARTSAGSGTFETALELPLESDVEPDACCRTSSSGPELSSGQTWLSTDQQSGRLLYMSTSPGGSYDQSTTKQLSKVMINQQRNNLARLQMFNALQTAIQSHLRKKASRRIGKDECAIRG